MKTAVDSTKRVPEDVKTEGEFKVSDHYSRLEAKLLPNGNLCIAEMADGAAPVIVVSFCKYTDWITVEQKQKIAEKVMGEYSAYLNQSLNGD